MQMLFNFICRSRTNMANPRHEWTGEDDLVLVTARARFQQLPGIYRRIRLY